MHVSSYTYEVLSLGHISRVRVLTPDQYFFYTQKHHPVLLMANCVLHWPEILILNVNTIPNFATFFSYVL